jgi:hypothetical protein
MSHTELELKLQEYLNLEMDFFLMAHYQLVITKLLDMMNMSTIGIHHMNKLLLLTKM